MLKVDAENLRDEFFASREFTKRHTDGPKKIIDRYFSNYYDRDRSQPARMADNHSFEYVSVIEPSLIFNDPRVQITAANPYLSGDPRTGIPALYQTTMGGLASGLQSMANAWSRDDALSDVLFEIASDFIFWWGVVLVTSRDQPGMKAGERFTPRRPLALRIDPTMWGIDPRAKTDDVFSPYGPRFMWHMWVADLDSLMKDPAYDKQVLESIGTDTDFDKLGGDDFTMNHQVGTPDRKEVVGIDMWVPEHVVDDETADVDGFNGSWHTLAFSSNGVHIGKRPRLLRKPVNAFTHPKGPYVTFGAYKIPNKPIAMSPLVATAEESELLNWITDANSRDVGTYKKFGVVSSANEGEAVKLANVRNGAIATMTDPMDFMEKEIGGVPNERLVYESIARERLLAKSGLSSSKRGSPQKGVTATAESISEEGSDIRVQYLIQRFNRGVSRIFENVAYDAFYGHDVVYRFHEEDPKTRQVSTSIFMGGLYPGQEGFSYWDLNISIEPHSMGHVSQALLQRRSIEILNAMASASSLMAQAPFMNWVELVKPILQAFGRDDAENLIDMDMLQQVAAINLINQTESLSPGKSAKDSSASNRVRSQDQDLAVIAGNS